MATTKGAYTTRQRALELERQIADIRRELGEKVAAAEARAAAAESRANAIYGLLVNALTRRREAPVQ